jgi:hypothetical protein
VPTLTDEQILAAILEHGGVAQAAEVLGYSRAYLYKAFQEACEAAQAELRERALKAPPVLDTRIRMSDDMIAELDRVARARGVGRTALVLEVFEKLPQELPAPTTAEDGRPVPVRIPADVWKALQRAAGRDASGVARGIFRQFLSRK